MTSQFIFYIHAHRFALSKKLENGITDWSRLTNMGKEFIIISPMHFDRVHSHIGIFQQRVYVFAIIRVDGNAYAGAGSKFMVTKYKLLPKGL